MFFGLTYFGSCARCLAWTGWRDGTRNRTPAALALGFLPGGPCLPAVLLGGIFVFIDAFIRSRGGWPVFDRNASENRRFALVALLRIFGRRLRDRGQRSTCVDMFLFGRFIKRIFIDCFPLPGRFQPNPL